MWELRLGGPDGRAPRVLCIGAHCDDIEIGCGGTLLRLLEANPALEVHYLVLCSDAARRREALDAAGHLLGEAAEKRVRVLAFRDGFLPWAGAEVKECFESLKRSVRPDLILLDEPMAGMNLEEKEDMARYIVDLNEEWGMTVVMIEHDMGVVMDISHRVMVLDFGKLIAEGQPREVMDDEQVKRAYLGVEDEEGVA